MKTTEFVKVYFKGKEYKINIHKIEAVLSVLAKKNVKINSDEILDMYLKRYKLYDKDFLEKINRI